MQDDKIIKEIHEKFIDDPFSERYNIAALICEKSKKICNQLVVVGGSAVEFYTYASYVTLDIDFIASSTAKLAEVMRSLGFIEDERHTWYHKDTSMVVEFPKGPLDGDTNRLRPVKTDYGYVYIIGIEDIILDRISRRASKWQDESSWPEYMIDTHFDDIDFDYINDKVSNDPILKPFVDKAISDVKSYRMGKSPYIRNLVYSDEIAIAKLRDKVFNDKSLEQSIDELSDDKQIKGASKTERINYLQGLANNDTEILEWFK